MKFSLIRTVLIVLVAAMLLVKLVPVQGQKASSHVVISQLFAGGGNTGAPYHSDYVELLNTGNVAQDLTGWSIQYMCGTSLTCQWMVAAVLPSISLAPGQYFLIQEFTGTNGTNLPTPDFVGTFNFATTAGTVMLANNSTQGGGAGIIDSIGYGSPTSYPYIHPEGTPLGPLSATTAALRKINGCQDTDDNATDFTLGTPGPRNSVSAFNMCSLPPNPYHIGIYNGGEFYLSSDNQTVLQHNWFGPGAPWTIVTGDWNGNGVDSIGIVNNNEFYIANDNATPAQHAWFGPGAPWTMIWGDWDGDGVSSVGIVNNNEFYLSNDNTNVAQHLYFGPGGSWLPLVGDWDGNGTTTVGIVNNNQFNLSNDNSTVASHFYFGPGGNWKPIISDWDGNGSDTIGIYLNNEFKLSNNNATVASHFYFGPGGSWKPIVGRWGNGSGAVPSQHTQPKPLAPTFVPKK